MPFSEAEEIAHERLMKLQETESILKELEGEVTQLKEDN